MQKALCVTSVKEFQNTKHLDTYKIAKHYNLRCKIARDDNKMSLISEGRFANGQPKGNALKQRKATAKFLFKASPDRIIKSTRNLEIVNLRNIKIIEPFRGQNKSTIEHIVWLQKLEDALRLKLRRVHLDSLNKLRTGTSGLPLTGHIREHMAYWPVLLSYDGTTRQQKR